MNNLLERLINAALIIALVWLLSGCQTVKGFAGDVSWSADTVNRAVVVPE